MWVLLLLLLLYAFCLVITKVALVSFLTGWMLMANIGVGITSITFLSLSVFLGADTQRTVPTAVVCGGWCSVFPLLVNSFYLKQLPLLRVLLTIPGAYCGALFAPVVTSYGYQFFFKKIIKLYCGY